MAHREVSGVTLELLDRRRPVHALERLIRSAQLRSNGPFRRSAPPLVLARGVGGSEKAKTGGVITSKVVSGT